MTDTYIALYSTGQRGKYHWQLVFPTSSGGALGHTGLVFQVRLKEVWVTEHYDCMNLLEDPTFLCVVRLPPVSDPIKAQQIAAGEDPGQRDTPLLWTHSQAGLGWSCAQWIIRILRTYIAEGIMTDSLTAGAKDKGANFYLQICGLGAKAEDDEGAGQTEDGVWVLWWNT
ncbi:hypothetical protein OE88DRAFT_1658841 [Heliocybe sulcata]|uniref:Uncharacterized protein n=1 Tax=Heliocybe sulcata TaxID=5364 RepID=A0A5C3NET9_9AGAM|nr:hypothetical protein OE88DRAFT_1658841 [Heliocybe sulcata]